MSPPPHQGNDVEASLRVPPPPFSLIPIYDPMALDACTRSTEWAKAKSPGTPLPSFGISPQNWLTLHGASWYVCCWPPAPTICLQVWPGLWGTSPTGLWFGKTDSTP